jgi:microcystin-dependent protein
MSKLSRVTQLIFGSNAGLNQIGKFGSFAAGSPVYTTDPAVVQSLSNYLTGWFGAVVGNNSPTIEDMNAICYLYAYQLAYLMQSGIPEYDAGTTYYAGNWVQSGGVAYVSLTNNNLGNAVSNPTYWGPPISTAMIQPAAVTPDKLSSSVAIVPSGALMPFAGGGAPSGWLICDGSAVSRTTYSSLYAAIGATYGSGNGSTTFNVPDMRGNVPMGANGSYPLGSSGGEASHVLTTSEMPVHSHTDSGHSHGGIPNQLLAVQSGTGTTVIGGGTTGNTGSASANIQNAGSGGAHNNLQPYQTFNYIIKV